VRRTVFLECARILKPGGRFVLVDSLQLGDRPDYDGLLALFPKHYHEPYYSTYISENFAGVAEASGLTQVRHFNAFVSKVMVFDKPGERSPRASGSACRSISTVAKA
jgi:ubiquinone/menaquinone biosynthesis C-methylase UbiE